ncbi:MAG: hypothetical protein SFW07_04080 [Gammaproteobacteria bacterium]|nr:hypothetical protein [Gammaproteobacteria bacterium]
MFLLTNAAVFTAFTTATAFAPEQELDERARSKYRDHRVEELEDPHNIINAVDRDEINRYRQSNGYQYY